MPNLHCEDCLKRKLCKAWHKCFYTAIVVVVTFILGAKVGQSRHNFVWLFCSITSLHRILSRHRAALNYVCKDALSYSLYLILIPYGLVQCYTMNFLKVIVIISGETHLLLSAIEAHYRIE